LKALLKIFFIAYKQLFSKEQSRFVSMVTFSSSIAIALGVAAMIIVLSVMNGFEAEIQERVIRLNSDITIKSNQPIRKWQDILIDLGQFEEIELSYPFIETKAILNHHKESSAVFIQGINPVFLREEYKGSFFGIDLKDLGMDEIILGKGLALKLNLKPGDTIMLTVARVSPNGKLGFTDTQYFNLREVVEFGLQQFDSSQGIIHMDRASSLLGLGQSINGVAIELVNAFQAKAVAEDIEKSINNNSDTHYNVRDWTEENQTLFDAIMIEKTIMSVLLFLVILIATFNIIVMLSISVDDKKRDIAVLRSIGFSSKDLAGIFFCQGLLIIILGILCGVIIGISILVNIDSVEGVIRYLFGFEFLPAGLYYITSMPYILRYTDIFFISFSALIVSILACLYPSIRASRGNPAEILKAYKG